MHKVLFILFLATAVFAQAPDEPSAGSVSGVVRDSVSGAPMADVNVYITLPSRVSFEASTDSQGRYTLDDVPPGDHVVTASHRESGGRESARVHMEPGQQVENLDIRIDPMGIIAGRVVDEDGEPVPGVTVYLIERNYILGELRYSRGARRPTNDQGEFRVERVAAGRAYRLLAERTEELPDVLSRDPEDPSLRAPVLASTYYPDVEDVQAAVPITLSPGETRENLEIRMARAPSYCIDGRIEHPSPQFLLEADGEFTALSPSYIGGTTMFVIASVSPRDAGPEGSFRICGLQPREYRFTAVGTVEGSPPAAEIRSLVISDTDIHDLVFTPTQGPPLTGEVAWAPPAPEEAPGDGTIVISLIPLNRGRLGRDEQSSLYMEDAPVSGSFRIEHLLPDDYSVSVRELPEGVYVEDITYAGLSILNKPLSTTSAMGEAQLRVILGHDPGHLAVEVTDSDGNPVPQATIIVAPEAVRTEAEFAAAIEYGATDQTGRYQSGAIAPGEYLVMTTDSRVDYSTETIGHLWRARIDAEEVDLAAGQTAQVRLEDPRE